MGSVIAGDVQYSCKTPGAIVGYEKQPGGSISCWEISSFPKIVNSSFFLVQFAGDCLQPTLIFTVQISSSIGTERSLLNHSSTVRVIKI
ncbi:MAG: hypothetical protein WCQ90_14485 [Deltaproteobacteria bacterium]